MGRPLKTNASWWKHPAGFRDDKRIKVLRAKHGVVGYAIFNLLIEVLISSDYFTVNTNDPTELLCMSSDFGVSIDELTGVIRTAQSVHLLEYDEEGALYSPLVNTAMEALVAKRSKDKARIAQYRSEKTIEPNCSGYKGREYVLRRDNIDNSDIDAIFAHDKP